MDKSVMTMAFVLLFLFGLTFAAHVFYVQHDAPAAAAGEHPQPH